MAECTPIFHDNPQSNIVFVNHAPILCNMPNSYFLSFQIGGMKQRDPA